MPNILETTKCPSCGRLTEASYPTRLIPKTNYVILKSYLKTDADRKNIQKCTACGKCIKHSTLIYRPFLTKSDEMGNSYGPSIMLLACMDCGTFICDCNLRKEIITNLIPNYWKPIYHMDMQLEFTQNNCDYCKGNISNNHTLELNHAEILGLKYLKEKYPESFDFLFANNSEKVRAEFRKRRDLHLYGEKGTEYFYKYIYPYKEKYELCTREAQNYFRKKNGLPGVGEGWLSETSLFELIKKIFSQYLIRFHHRPKWLEHLEIDIFIPELNIGIEYMGIQHYKPIDFFGGKEAFEWRKKLDLKKGEICKKEGVNLIYFTYEDKIDFENVKKKLAIYLK